MYRTFGSLVLAVALPVALSATAGPATAATPPANDTADHATDVSLGFSEVLDTSAMTTGPYESQIASYCDAYVVGGVWYTLVGTGDPVEVMTTGSSYRSYVFAESVRGSVREIEQCEWPRFDTEKGVRYRVLVADEDPSDGIGGSLHVSFDKGAPDPTGQITLSRSGIVQANGAARLHGTYRCTDASTAYLFIQVTQRVAPHAVIGPVFTQEFWYVNCDGRPHRWSLAAGRVYNPETDLWERVRFKPGRARVQAGIDSICADLACSEGAGVDHFVRLRKLAPS